MRTDQKLNLFVASFPGADNDLFLTLMGKLLDAEHGRTGVLDEWIDERFCEEYEEWDWEMVANMTHAYGVEAEDIAEYADELGIKISNEIKRDLLVLDDWQ